MAPVVTAAAPPPNACTNRSATKAVAEVLTAMARVAPTKIAAPASATGLLP